MSQKGTSASSDNAGVSVVSQVDDPEEEGKHVIFAKMKPFQAAPSSTTGDNTSTISTKSSSASGGGPAAAESQSQSLPPISDDSNSPNVECFQNFTAPEVFIQGLAGMVNQQDIETIVKSQRYMLQRFEKSNEMLVNCNELAAIRFQHAMQDFKKHVQLLKEFHKDMDNVFKRIRIIKAKLASQYPQQFEAAASMQRREKSLSHGDGDDDEEE